MDNILIRFGSKQIIGIPIGTNYIHIIADLSSFRYEGDNMLSLSDKIQSDVIEAFNFTSRYLDDFLNIGNPYCEQLLS